MIATATITILTALVATVTVVSYLQISHGIVRMCAFPRLQTLCLAAILLVATLVFIEPSPLRWVLLAALLASIVAHSISIGHFLPIRRKESKLYAGGRDDPNTISLMALNVKQSNRKYRLAIDLTREVAPDVALFIEVDSAWCDALAELEDRYPYRVVRPLDNAYGMAVYSRLELSEIEVRELVIEGVPSITAVARLASGHRVRLYAVHPEPPVPNEDAAGRDAELILVARMVERDDLPAIVFGDLNDVGWSETTRLFQRISQTADPRVGRGFYNTFDARYPLLRWPLDHLFHDRRFDLVEMQRLRHVGSDHFPMYFKLALTPGTTSSEGLEPETQKDREVVREITEDARKIDRLPIGSDWES